jgi:serine/threonine protein kinase
MSNERLGKVKFSAQNETVYFCKANDNDSSVNSDDEVFLSCVAEKLGKPGGQGRAYKVTGGPFPVPIVIKRYKDKILSEHGPAIGAYLRGLISFRSKASAGVKDAIDKYTVWPKMLVYDYASNKVSGFAMNLIPSGFFVEMTTKYGEIKTKESNLDFILHGDDFRRKHGLPVLSNNGRAKIVFDFIRIVLLLHRNDYVLGDLSPKNTLIHVDSKDQKKNSVLLIDTDSFRRKLNQCPLSQPHTPNWIPPECLKAKVELRTLTPNANPNKAQRLKNKFIIQNNATDVWKLCMAIYRLYHGIGNASSIEVSPSSEMKLRKEIGDDFLMCVKRGMSDDPEQRPTVAELLGCFKKCLQAKQGR